MGSSIISGRVDNAVRDRAAAFIDLAGLNTAEVIKQLWEHIARTGEVPTYEEDEKIDYDPYEAFMKLRESQEPTPEWLVNLDDKGRNELIASRYA